jgi:hypothetical protein
MHGLTKDLTGMVFGRLTIIKMAPRNSRHISWECVCFCGTKIIVSGGHLTSGHTQSCGCLWKEAITHHNHNLNDTKTRTYTSWEHAKYRCTNRNNDAYKNYGGRNIQMCDRWKNSFSNFLMDMGERPFRFGKGAKGVTPILKTIFKKE